MPLWTSGRVALVGDAGYCPSPAAGMGGSVAIRGATALYDAFLNADGDIASAFAEYERSFRADRRADPDRDRDLRRAHDLPRHRRGDLGTQRSTPRLLKSSSLEETSLLQSRLRVVLRAPHDDRPTETHASADAMAGNLRWHFRVEPNLVARVRATVPATCRARTWVRRRVTANGLAARPAALGASPDARRGPVRLHRSPLLAPGVPYAYAASTPTAGRLVFTAGACPLDADGRTVAIGDVAGQAEQVMANLAGRAARGGRRADRRRQDARSSSRPIAQEDLLAAWEVVRRRFGDHDAPGPCSASRCSGYNDQLVEVEAVAVVRDDATG